MKQLGPQLDIEEDMPISIQSYPMDYKKVTHIARAS